MTHIILPFVINFFRLEAAGGIVLLIASVAALLIANSPLFTYYDHALNGFHFGFSLPEIFGVTFAADKSVLHWINDALMVIFFFLVGMEIKREMAEGELSSPRRALLPALAALGGMVIPALIYWFINQDNPAALRGWAIPSATDIAFALGVLAVVGSRAPLSLKILLTAIAIIDDLGAIIIIALFYTSQIDTAALLFALVPVAGLFILNRRCVSSPWPYLFLGILLWLCVLQSGIHATIAGVVLAMFIPLRAKNNPDHSPLRHLEHTIHPWVVFGILPIFGFANAGVPFAGMGWGSLAEPVSLGIILGLFVGKQIGIFLTITGLVLIGLCPKPEGAGWLQLYALSLLCGIGFTMSLFIGGLSFDSVEMQASVRLGVLAGSLLSAVLAYGILRYAPPAKT
jgi:NhaA family Na+:H+ antiporter